MKLKDMLEKRAKLLNDAKALIEKDAPTAEDRQSADKMIAEAEGLKADITRAQTLDTETRALDGAINNPTRPEPVMTKKDEKRYSLLRAIRSRLDGKPLDGLEKEVNDELARRSGKTPQGFLVPWNLPTEQRDVLASNSANAIATDLSSDLITTLRNKMVLQSMGARVLSDMQGDFSIPKQTAASAAYWVTGDAAAVTESEPRIAGQVLFQPKTVGSFVDLSRKFINQSSVDAEMFARNDLAIAVALELDRVGLNGSGTGSEPEGILQNGSVSTVAIGTNGGAPTWEKIVEMESAVAALNADVGSLGYIINAKVRGKLKTTAKAANTAQFIWEQGNTVNGYRSGVTNAVPSNLTKGTGTALSAAIFGNFADLVYALWSGLDIVVDPFTGATAGTVRIVALQDATVKLRQTESFSKCVDIVTA